MLTNTKIKNIWHPVGFVLASSMILGLGSGLPSVPVRAQTSFYVATNGNDANSGSLESPFKTIQKCATVAQTGDTCFVKEGIYRETVTPANSGVTFKNFNGQKVTISGTEIIPNTSWTNHGGNIFKAPMNWNMNVRTWYQTTNNQIFVDGRMMVEARWPNIPVGNATSITNQAGRREDDARADSATNLQEYSATYGDGQLQQVPSGLFNGGKINYGVGVNMVHTSCDVVNQTQSQVDFACNDDNGDRTKLGLDNDKSDDYSFYYSPRKGNYYYLWGKLEALDNPGEWFWKDNTLYLMMPDNSDPSTSGKVIEARKRAYGFDLKGKSNTVIDGVNLFAAGINTDSATDNSLFQNMEIRYLWHFQHIRPRWLTWQGTRGFVLNGDNNMVKNNYFAYSASSMIAIADGTYSNQIINNVIHDAGYMGSDVTITGFTAGETNKHQVKNNTVYNAGRFIVNAGIGDITYNDFYNSHLQINDLGTVYEWGFDGKNNQVAYNYIHDNYAELDNTAYYYGGFGIYLDDDTFNFKIYRNLIWNHSHDGISAYGTNGTVLSQFTPEAPSNRLFFNNSVLGTISANAKPNYRGLPHNLNGAIFKNNLADEIRISTTKGAVNENNFTNPQYLDPSQPNFGLRNYSPGMESGLNLGSPYMDAPMSPINNPESGALEFGRPIFVAGATLRPQDLAQLVVSCEKTQTLADCQIKNLPVGRKLDQNFAMKIGTNTPTICSNSTNYQTHTSTGHCQNVAVSPAATPQDIFIKSGNNDWQKIGELEPNSSKILSISPSSGPSTGGSTLTIIGQGFNSPQTYSRQITIPNQNSALENFQVLVEIDTQSLISAGKMRSDCGDVRFSDQYGQISYWLEDGCDTPKTRFWVKVPFLASSQNSITMTYGDQSQTSASNPVKTFEFFDDFSRTSLGDKYFINPSNNTGTVSVSDGQLRLSGSTNSTNQFNNISVGLSNITYPSEFAIDSEMSVLSGSPNFKAAAGSVAINVQGSPGTSGKNLAYWNGSAWVNLGKSSIDSAQFQNKKISVSYLGESTNRTITWAENGDFQALAARTGLSNPNIGTFSYGPDTTFENFDVRYDNIRIRKAASIQPLATVAPEQATPAVTVDLGTNSCQNPAISVLGIYSSITCQIPAHVSGPVPVIVTDRDGQKYVYSSYEYLDNSSSSSSSQAQNSSVVNSAASSVSSVSQTSESSSSPTQSSVSTSSSTSSTSSSTSTNQSFVYLLTPRYYAFSPNKSQSPIYATQDLTLTFRNIPNIQPGATCIFKIKPYPMAGHSNAEYSQQDLINPTSSYSDNCQTTLPTNKQTYPRYQFQVRITNPDGTVFGAEPEYLFNYGALGVVEVGIDQ